MPWDLARGEEFLPRTSLSELKRLMRTEHEAKPRLRLLIALHRKQGKPLDEIAEACGVPRRTVHGTIERFQERGVAAAHAAKKDGRPPRLSPGQRRALVRELERGPAHNPAGLWTTKQVRELIRKKFGVAYAPQHVWRILKACGFALLRPRPRHYKAANRIEMERFKKKRGASQVITADTVLSWPAKTKRRSVYGQPPRVAGRAKEASPSQS